MSSGDTQNTERETLTKRLSEEERYGDGGERDGSGMVSRAIGGADKPMSTELPPVAVCTKCGDLTYSPERINSQCDQKPDGKRRCEGVYGSAMNNDDWEKCGACGGFGRTGTAEAAPCAKVRGGVLSATAAVHKFKLGR